MLRAIGAILLMAMVTETATVPAYAEWEMSEFTISLGWASHGDPPDAEARMEAIAQAGFNTVMWYDPNTMDLAHQYGLKQLIQVKPHTTISNSQRQHPTN